MPFRPSPLALLLLLLGPLFATAQPGWRKAARDFQRQLDHEYADTATSPLPDAEVPAFKTLGFFPVRKAYCVQATFIRTEGATPFEMPTVSGKTKTFVQYGLLVFNLNGRPDTLAAYQNLKLAAMPEHADELFIPFKDHSSGEESYGGGRYMDIKIPQSATITLDFNQCYNPYCAYSTGWNCPIPPVENYIDAKVLAGVRAWDKGPH